MGKLKASLLSISFVFKRPYVFALETENLSGFIRIVVSLLICLKYKLCSFTDFVNHDFIIQKM